MFFVPLVLSCLISLDDSLRLEVGLANLTLVFDYTGLMEVLEFQAQMSGLKTLACFSFKSHVGILLQCKFISSKQLSL
jgi:hypothetical protein